MRTYSFTLVLSGIAEITPPLADALYEAVHGDIEFNVRDGVAFLELERSATSLRKAILGAIEEVEGARRAGHSRRIGGRQRHCQD